MANYQLLFLTERSLTHQAWARRVAPANVELFFYSHQHSKSDVVCSLLPYSSDTKGAISGEAFAQIKRGAIFVHYGSGGVIDEMALTKALCSGHLGGAALDTYEWEPLPQEHPLRLLARDPSQNILLPPTSPMAALTKGSTIARPILQMWCGCCRERSCCIG